MFSAGVQLGRPGRQEEQGDVLGALELAGGVPAGAVEQQDGMGAGRDPAGDLLMLRVIQQEGVPCRRRLEPRPGLIHLCRDQASPIR